MPKYPEQADGISNLHIAIVRQAVKDYKKALRKKMSGKDMLHSAEDLERWFRSEHGQLLTLGKWETIIDRCRRAVGYVEQEEEQNMLVVTVKVNCPEGQVQAVKESLAMYLERFGDSRVVEIREIRPEQMTMTGVR